MFVYLFQLSITTSVKLKIDITQTVSLFKLQRKHPEIADVFTYEVFFNPNTTDLFLESISLF